MLIQKMFKKKSSLPAPTSPVKYPHASFVHTEAGYFYIVDDTRRYRLISSRVVDSWRPHRVIETSEAALKSHRVTAKMQFRNGSLIWNISDGKIYLIEHGKRRHVQSPDRLLELGIVNVTTGDNVQIVSLDELNLHEEGEPLT